MPDGEISIQVASIVISIFALLATAGIAIGTWVQTVQSVRPFLYTTSDTHKENDEHQVVFQLHNGGLGPAIVKDYYVIHDNKQYRGESVHNIIDEVLPHYIDTKYLYPDGALRPEEDYTILRVRNIGMEDDTDEIQREVKEKFTLIVKYKSFIGLSYTYNSKDHMWTDTADENQDNQ